MREIKFDTPLKGAKLVRSMLPQIEASINDGYSLTNVWESLERDHNLNLTFSSFKKTLYREQAKVKALGSTIEKNTTGSEEVNNGESKPVENEPKKKQPDNNGLVTLGDIQKAKEEKNFDKYNTHVKGKDIL